MSKENSSLPFTNPNTLKTAHTEANENEFENSANSTHFVPPRTPLNSIPDPSQYLKESQESDFDSRDKFEGVRVGRVSDRQIEALDNSTPLNKGIGGAGFNYGTPRVSGRGKAQSEPNSAQNTPARTVSKTTNFGAMGASTGPRPPQHTGARGSSSRVSRGISVIASDPSAEVPHFEVVEVPSFWMDHNVQVLIRIRPLSTVERASQGYGRCLRQESAQSLVWLGHPETRFTFDHIACETISQEKLFRVAGLPMVENCMSGYNSCMFAYGQTGSGKTYTMMGEIHEMEAKLNDNCGITPRIFDYLFSRIRAEEENRRGEKLKFSCKCSFLEIYNEQITDLLEPSSTNLQLREDLKKGVYVENLTEYNVTTVNDVANLLLQGAANRKMAATHMNSESSRSHSVFTCIIESHWEKDSMNHFRFGRLNLVDLAGSERQKTSGAEGDRLKEAANINKSLSTLGLVIMSLVDLAHGKHRHVPYRDSRLTFLLQDSLGGNSKTTIIANVSPSNCSANETLSTLKFAQRAKLIQNNAKVNEDASGDVTALQQQIQQLKGQLSFLMKHHNVSRSMSDCKSSSEWPRAGALFEEYGSSEEKGTDDCCIPSLQKIKCMEANLAGALRREKKAEAEICKLEAEIEHLNHLAHQREEDMQRTKMMLRFREEKIKRIELFSNGSIVAEKYLVEENSALQKEIQMLEARIDKNPELTRFALENIKHVEQLRLFQGFYEQGERETLISEVPELHDQLLESLEGKSGELKFYLRKENQDINTLKELEDCRNMNSKLIRGVDDLQTELRSYVKFSHAASDSVTDSYSKDSKEYKESDKYSLVESISVRSDRGDEADDEVLQDKNSHNMDNTFAIPATDIQKELRDAKLFIEAMESEHIRLTKELQFMQEENHRYKEVLNSKANTERQCVLKLTSENHPEESDLDYESKGLVAESNEDVSQMVLQAKIDGMKKELDDAKLLNSRYQEAEAVQLSHQHQIELVNEQVEMETAKTIIHLQEEVATVQLELHEKLHSMTQENLRLKNTIAAKEDELRALCLEWEKATIELMTFLADGSKSIKDAYDQMESISCSFPEENAWIGEHIERAAKVWIEKEETILFLQKSLEDAQKVVMEMELKLSSLKGATMALTEVHQLENDGSTKEAIQSTNLLNGKINTIKVLESHLKQKEDQILELEKCANAAFLLVNRLSDCHIAALTNNVWDDAPISKMAVNTKMGSHQISELKDNKNALHKEDIYVQVDLACLGVLDVERAIKASYGDTETHLLAVHTDIHEALSIHRELVQELVQEFREMRKNFKELKEARKSASYCSNESLSLRAHKCPNSESQCHMLLQIKDELAETNVRLNDIKVSINIILKAYGCAAMAENLINPEGQSADCFTSEFDLSLTDDASEEIYDGFSSACCSRFTGKVTEQELDIKVDGGLIHPSDGQESPNSLMLLKNLTHNEAAMLRLRKEFKIAFHAFNELYVQLAGLSNVMEIGGCSFAMGACFPCPFESINKYQEYVPKTKKPIQPAMPDRSQVLQSLEFMRETEAHCYYTRKFDDERINQANSLLTKLDEAHATMKEADLMLNTLLKANENAKQLTCMWKQASEELNRERASLIKEIEQLKSSIQRKEGENELLQEQMHYTLKEMMNLMSLLEGSFLQMQIDVEEKFKVMHADALSIGQSILCCIYSSRLSVEDINSDIMEKNFALFVLYECLLGELSHTISKLNVDPLSLQAIPPQRHLIINSSHRSCLHSEDGSMVDRVKSIQEGDLGARVTNLQEGEHILIYENLSLKKEMERKEVLLKGLLFDFSLLQESASNTQDFKDETDRLIKALGQVRHDLEKQSSQLDDALLQNEKLEACLADTETALFTSNSDLQQAKSTLDSLSKQNDELIVLMRDLCLKKSEAEEQLAEQKDTIKGLEKEILRLNSSVEKSFLTSFEDINDDLKRVISERNQLLEDIGALNIKLEMAYALADENEAIAVEARQESEASKLYAEEKEEEVKILEHSVEELEFTINVLEKKVNEMDEEVERHRLIRDSSELEIQALRQRMLSVENFTENIDSENFDDEQIGHHISRKLQAKLLELDEAHNHVGVLEKERAQQAKEIKQCKDYISELVLHAEAQASQYQQKYKTLEAMLHEVKADSLKLTSTAPTLDKPEKSTIRTRGSGSPFRCIPSLVLQMNLEKDQKLSMAKLRIEELESLLASRQKEVCMLNTRLAAAESMTHDVIRDLLGVKLDMTNYANLIDKNQFQNLLEAAQQRTEESLAKEQEILKLQKQINDLIEEKENCILDIKKRDTDVLAAHIAVEQLQQRDQLLTVQNEMLKMDKINLTNRVLELDEMVKKLFAVQNTQQEVQHPAGIKDISILRTGDADLTNRLAVSEKLLARVNNELAHYSISGGTHPHSRTDGHCSETKNRDRNFKR